MNNTRFNELTDAELMNIDGGVISLLVAGIICGTIFVAGLVVGVYVGYKEVKNK